MLYAKWSSFDRLSTEMTTEPSSTAKTDALYSDYRG